VTSPANDEPDRRLDGQENKLGISDPHAGNPDTVCNPNRTPLPPQPNRTKELLRRQRGAWASLRAASTSQ
jgi:hypothetical protein